MTVKDGYLEFTFEAVYEHMEATFDAYMDLIQGKINNTTMAPEHRTFHTDKMRALKWKTLASFKTRSENCKRLSPFE